MSEAAADCLVRVAPNAIFVAFFYIYSYTSLLAHTKHAHFFGVHLLQLDSAYGNSYDRFFLLQLGRAYGSL